MYSTGCHYAALPLAPATTRWPWIPSSASLYSVCAPGTVVACYSMHSSGCIAGAPILFGTVYTARVFLQPCYHTQHIPVHCYYSGDPKLDLLAGPGHESGTLILVGLLPRLHYCQYRSLISSALVFACLVYGLLKGRKVSESKFRNTSAADGPHCLGNLRCSSSPVGNQPAHHWLASP